MSTMQGRRLVTVAVPDSDDCERIVRYGAEKMCQGTNIMIVDLHPLIQGDALPRLADKFTEVVRDYAGAIRHHLESTTTATARISA